MSISTGQNAESHEGWWGGRIFSDEKKAADSAKKGIVFYENGMVKACMDSWSFDVTLEGHQYKVNRNSALKFFYSHDELKAQKGIDDTALIGKILDHYNRRRLTPEAREALKELESTEMLPDQESMLKDIQKRLSQVCQEGAIANIVKEIEGFKKEEVKQPLPQPEITKEAPKEAPTISAPVKEVAKDLPPVKELPQQQKKEVETSLPQPEIPKEAPKE
ncbi:MAG: hypothetical protein JSR46_06720, partial [Verrucomicrobia bacterium]|nr:hypothetical protein [Verrucomicrobiota bacterium]